MRLSTYLYYRTGFATLVSRGWRAVTEMARERLAVPLVRNFDELAKHVNIRLYKPDGDRPFGIDPISSPEHVAWKMKQGVAENLDCDDFASFIVGVASESKRAGTFDDGLGFERAYFLGVFWDGGGHATAALKCSGGYRWMDYSLPSPLRPTLRDTAVAVGYWQGRKPYLYVVLREDLSVEEMGWLA